MVNVKGIVSRDGSFLKVLKIRSVLSEHVLLVFKFLEKLED
jgi:hypothetical protein